MSFEVNSGPLLGLALESLMCHRRRESGLDREDRTPSP